jgi:cytochrome c-type biogenesis protein CcmF
MFIGSFILFLSAMQIIISTSIPVWSPLAKMITGKDVAPPVEPVQHYNSIQVWVAIIVGLLTATVLFLRFRSSDNKIVFKRLGITASIALALSLLIGFTQKIDTPQYAILLFVACYTIVGMLYYTIKVQKGKLKKLGPATSHFGFGLILLGILLSSYNKEVISYNTLGVRFGFSKDAGEDIAESRENVLLYRNVPVAMGDYFATYQGDSIPEGDARTFYKVHYQRIDSATKEVKESFMLYPNAFVNPKGQDGGLSANPASKHYLHKDIFTYVTSVIDPTKKTDTSSYKSHVVHEGDTIYANTGYLVFKGFETDVENPQYQPATGDIAVTARLEVYDLSGVKDTLAPVYFIREGFENHIEDTMKEMTIYTRLAKILPDQNAAEIMVRQPNPQDEYIVMKALVFPFINVLWLGIIVMVFGFFLTAWNRATKKDKPTVLNV